jgi:hypothetical protein
MSSPLRPPPAIINEAVLRAIASSTSGEPLESVLPRGRLSYELTDDEYEKLRSLYITAR